MAQVREEAVDIPEPEVAGEPGVPDVSLLDPGSDTPPPRREPGLGEDPAYDPGGMGWQPDAAEDDEDWGR